MEPTGESMSEKQVEPLILVDGSSYLYRAFHASERAGLKTVTGYPTGAISVVTLMLNRLVRQYTKSCIVVVFDAKGKNFRHEIYPEYKATRSVMPTDLQLQIAPIHKIVEALGLLLLVEEGVEADDVLGTLATQASATGIPTLISTGDKDFAQLVDENITLVDTMKNTQMGPKEVKEKYGVPPELIIDYLALMGDKSDNIPGMSGVGAKSAEALLMGIGGIDEIEHRLGEVSTLKFRGSKKFAERFKEEYKTIVLSKQLATIRTDLELPFSIDQLVRCPEKTEELLALYQKYELKSLERGLVQQGNAQSNQELRTPKYELITDQKTFSHWVERLKKAPYFGFDTETTGLNYMTADLVGVSFSVGAGEAAYVPLQHSYEGVPVQLPMQQVLATLKSILEDPEQKKIGQNIKYDNNILARYNIEIKGVIFDTMLESYVLNSIGTKHDLDSLSRQYLNHNTIKFEDVVGKGAKQICFSQVSLESAASYAAEDADVTLQLHEVLWNKLQQEASLKKVFETIEMALVPVLSRIERNGALLDTDLLEKQSIELGKRLSILQEEAWEMAGEKFNLGSPSQLQDVLFNKMNLPVKKKTPKGQFSTNEEVLQELALDYPLPKLLLEYRSLNKLKTTYTDKLPGLVNPGTGRIHTSYHQAGTATGRLSSANPNLQNVPVRTEEGRKIRQAFIAPEGYHILAADYSQIELRIMAHLSKDDGLLEAFAKNMDVHQATAGEIFGVALEEVTEQQRRSAKAINFGLIYGMSAFGLSRQLGITRKAAQEYIDTYFEHYPGVLTYMDKTKAHAGEFGYVETLFGRRLYLPDIRAQNGMRRQAAERAAINAPMQGTAADIIKRAMIQVDHWLKEKTLDVRIILQVHDELVLEVADADLATVTQEIESVMARVAELDVPLLLGIGVGDNWEQAH